MHSGAPRQLLEGTTVDGVLELEHVERLGVRAEALAHHKRELGRGAIAYIAAVADVDAAHATRVASTSRRGGRRRRGHARGGLQWHDRRDCSRLTRELDQLNKVGTSVRFAIRQNLALYNL